jgi:integrase
MSVEKVKDSSGKVQGYKVRWRDSSGQSHRRTVRLQADAFALDAEMKRRKVMGELLVHEKGRIQLRDFYPIWLTQHARVHLAPRTLGTYQILYRRHLEPALGRSRLCDITADEISGLVSTLARDLAPSSVRTCVAIIQGILARAVEWRYITTNPAAGVKKPARDSRRGRALTPEQITRLVNEMPTLRSRAVVTLLAWSGIRPGELRGLRWGDFSTAVLRIERAISDDAVAPTKTRRQRSPDFRQEPRKLLLEWYMAQGQPGPDALVFPAVGTRDIWTDQGWRMWQRQTFSGAASRAGFEGLRPYDLRHTFASRLIRDGRDPVDIGRQLGHSPTMTLETYAHEFEQHRKGGAEAAADFNARAVFG